MSQSEADIIDLTEPDPIKRPLESLEDNDEASQQYVDSAPVPLKRSRGEECTTDTSQTTQPHHQLLTHSSAASAAHGYIPLALLKHPQLICTDFLADVCDIGNACALYHCTTSYQWQYYGKDNYWKNYRKRENREIEEAFCNPQNNSYITEFLDTLHFNKMSYTTMDGREVYVRRVSTPNAATTTSPSRHNTTWRWYQLTSPTNTDVVLLNANATNDNEIERDYDLFLREQKNSSQVDFELMIDRATGHTVTRRPLSITLAGSTSLASLDTPLQDEICLNFLHMTCTSTDCRYYHTPRPYMWQYKDTGGAGRRKGGGWYGFPNSINDYIELCFANLSKHDVTITFNNQLYAVILDQHSSDGHHQHPFQTIRRLSTPSHVVYTSTVPHVTRWKWYWREDEHTWTRYTNSDDIERAYSQKHAEYTIVTNGFTYTINTASMVQINKQTGTARQLRRRPEMMLPSELIAPDFWSVKPWQNAAPNSVHFSQLPTASDEYVEVAGKFASSCQHPIRNIQRIENITLWNNYERKRGSMRGEAGQEPKEQLLFHGTKIELIQAICTKGFDFRRAGSSNAAYYGHGCYFARDAQYSTTYVKSNDVVSRPGTASMLAVRVLTGVYTEGSRDMKHPPPRDASAPHGLLYDSCVNDTKDPSIYVVFDMHQAYPAYVVNY